MRKGSGTFGSKQYQESQKSSVTSRIGYGLYPLEVAANVSVSYEFLSDGVGNKHEFKRKVMKIDLFAEKYLKKWFEIYCFLENFSNTYMGITDRLEVGCGFKFELDILTKKCKENWTKINKIEEIKDFLNNLVSILKKKQVYCLNQCIKLNKNLKKKEEIFYKKTTFFDNEDSIDDTIEEIRTYLKLLKNFNKKNKVYKELWDKQNAKWQFDFACSFLSDKTDSFLTYSLLKQKEYFVENEGIKRIWLDQDTGEKHFEPISKLRLTLRPGFKWRLSKGVELSSKWYFKIPLQKRFITYDNNGRKFDLRIDSFTRLIYKIPLKNSKSKISIGMQLDFLYDNAPPFLTNKERDNIKIEKNSSEEAQALGIKYYVTNYIGPRSYSDIKIAIGWEF
jgi:hypothetical protein